MKIAFIAFLLVTTLGFTLFTGCITIDGFGDTSTTTTSNSSNPATTTSTATPISPEWTMPSSSEITNELPSIADVVATVKPSVVAITTEVILRDFFNRTFTQEGAGSGWIIDEDGIIVTNNHVIEGASSITVTTDDGASYNAEISNIATDPLNDLAILKIDVSNLPALSLGDTSEMRVGDWVIAIGNALGQGIRATEGIISRKGVSLEVEMGQTLYDLLETSAAINPGNSGGPLVNLKGEVIGITSAKVAEIGVEGMGYAISIDLATPIIQELVNKGYVTRPYLGVSLYTVNQLAISQFKLAVDKGVLILEVVPDSPADKAGLQEGDVIVDIGGTDITHVDELTRILHASEIGKALEIKYYRGDKEYTTIVFPSESPR